MANIGQGIDRVDGRLKVIGRAHYAAEFTVPDVVHAVLVCKARSAPARHHGFRSCGGSEDARCARDHNA